MGGCNSKSERHLEMEGNAEGANGDNDVDSPPRKRSILHMPKDQLKSLIRVGSSTPSLRTSTYGEVHNATEQNFARAARKDGEKANSKPMGAVGLRNLGNTCFMNSSLQCLSNTIPLTDYFLGYDYRKEINKENFLGTGGELVTSYAKLMKTMWLGKNSSVNPSFFKSKISRFAPQFQGYHQHDAQELLGFLLDGIHEDLNRVKERPYVEDRDCDGKHDERDAIEAWKNYLRRNKSLVVDLFQGQLRNTCQCLTCHHRNIRFEPFMYLSLPVSDSCKTLQDCLDLYLSQDLLTGEDQWYCEKCKKHVDATKKTDLWILPPILIFHLKRFKYDEYGKVGSKNSAQIQYPLVDWDLSDSVCSKAAAKSSQYDLYAVSNHVGGLGSGHYTAHALNRFDENWYEFNDSRVTQVDPKKHISRNSSAYLLFYNRSGDGEESSHSISSGRGTPLVRRQSVSRPDLWPHTQREHMRSFKRSSMRMKASENMVEISMSKSHSSEKGDPSPGKAGNGEITEKAHAEKTSGSFNA